MEQVFFGVAYLGREFLSIQNDNLKIRGSARVSQSRSSADKVHIQFLFFCFTSFNAF